MFLKRALILHPNNDYNCGDQITFLGSKSLLTQALNGAQNLDVVQFDIVRAIREIDTYVSQYDWGHIDIVVLAGSPWLWDACERSTKYKLIFDALDRYPNAKKIGLGLGSCFSKKCYNNILYEGASKYFLNCSTPQKKLRDLYSKFDYLLARDQFAKYIFDSLNVTSQYTYDTSVYAYNFVGKKINTGQKKVLFFYDPSKGISQDHLDCDTVDYVTYQLNWAKENNADVYVSNTADKDTLNRLGVQCSFSVDLNFLSHKFVEYNEMLSGRIHMAVLGFLSGISKITVLPVDSRFMTILKLGINIKWLGEPWKYSHEVVERPRIWKNIRNSESIIVSDLRRVLSE